MEPIPCITSSPFSPLPPAGFQLLQRAIQGISSSNCLRVHHTFPPAAHAPLCAPTPTVLLVSLLSFPLAVADTQ